MVTWWLFLICPCHFCASHQADASLHMEVSAAGEAMQHLAHSNRFLRKEGSHGNLGGNLVPASIDSPALGSPSLQAKIHRKIQEAALGNAPLTEQATQEAAQQIAQANMPALGS